MVNVVGKANPFPLKISPDRRYFVGANGRPFLMVGDTPWMIVNQLTLPQIDVYLTSIASFGLTALLIEAPGFLFTDHSAGATLTGVDIANNTDGVAPFTGMDPFNWVLNEAYWLRVDYIVNRCKALGIFVWINPAYLGYQGTTGSGSGIEGCMGEVTGASAGTLQTYGAAMANRYTQGNVGWSEGGDYAGNTTERDKLHNVFIGIRSVRTTDLVLPHPARGESGYALFGPGGQNYAEFNVGATYTASNGTDAFSLAATEYGRSGPIPFVQAEDGYYGEATDAQAQRAPWESMLSGAAGVMFGTKLWSFGDHIAGGNVGAASALGTWLGSTGYQQMGYLVSLFRQFAWWKVVPNTGTGLVTTPALGSGTTRICPALSSDGSFAMIFTPGVGLTVDMSNFVQSSVRGRWFDPSVGTFAAASGSPYANTGTQAFSPPGGGTLVLVLD